MSQFDFDVGIIGGGPAGAATAAYLAKAGLSCVVFERELFPRPHVGESLVPSSTRVFHTNVRLFVDASGRRTLLGNQLKLRIQDSIFDQYAIHTWFEGYDRSILANEPSQDKYIFIRFIPLSNAWVWQIPITEMITSIGVVTQKKRFAKSKSGTPRVLLALNWHGFISIYYRLNVIFTVFVQDKRYRLDVVKLLQGDVYDEDERLMTAHIRSLDQGTVPLELIMS